MSACRNEPQCGRRPQHGRRCTAPPHGSRSDPEARSKPTWIGVSSPRTYAARQTAHARKTQTDLRFSLFAHLFCMLLTVAQPTAATDSTPDQSPTNRLRRSDASLNDQDARGIILLNERLSRYVLKVSTMKQQSQVPSSAPALHLRAALSSCIWRVPPAVQYRSPHARDYRSCTPSVMSLLSSLGRQS